MLPYYDLPVAYRTENYSFSIFGSIIVIGIIVGMYFLFRRAYQAKFPADHIFHTLVWLLPLSLFGNHVLGVLFYQPYLLTADYWYYALMNYKGVQSSFGGFISAIFLCYLYTLITRMSQRERRVYADIIVQSLVVSMAFGRLACTLAHDHPGVFTDFFLAFNFPEGPRHDLGFYELLFILLVLIPVNFKLHNMQPKPGTHLGVTLILYGAVRFLFEFLRINDLRHFGLTPAQYGSLIFVMWGTYLLTRIYSNAQARADVGQEKSESSVIPTDLAQHCEIH